MTRVEELTLKLADESLGEDDLRELEGLLAENQRARQVHIAILELEVRLRAKRDNLDLSANIMRRLKQGMAESIARDVMSTIRTQPAPEWMTLSRSAGDKRKKTEGRKPKTDASKSPLDSAGSPPPERSLDTQGRFVRFSSVMENLPKLKPVLLALAACVVIIVGLALWWIGPTVGEPLLTEVTGAGLSLERANQPLLPAVGIRLRKGDVLRTLANTTVAVTFAPEKTRLILQPDTELKLVSTSRGKRFALRIGQLAASVARQHPFSPMVILTEQARATVVGTEFTVLATTNSTRLDVFDGVVRLAKLSDGQAVRVPSGSFAIATAGTNLALQLVTGKVLREVWFDLPGDTLQDLTYNPKYPGTPSAHDLPSSFQTDTNWPSAFGTRTRGYLVSPANGDYVFQIDGAGQIALWLSPDEDPVGKVKIAQIVFTRNRPGDPPPENTRSQRESEPISLEAGRRYYIEAIHKYGDGQDRLTVTWKRPDGTVEPIPAQVLAPFSIQPAQKHR